MDFPTAWSKFRKTVWFRLTYLILIVLLSALLFFSGLGCFAYVLVPAVAVLLPISFGERRFRVHLVNGAFLILLLPVVYTLIATPYVIGAPQQAQSGADATGNNGIAAGVVTPFNAPSGTFHFQALVRSTNLTTQTIAVRVQVIDAIDIGFGPSQYYDMSRNAGEDGNLVNGENYSANITLSSRFHEFNFQVYRVDNVSGTESLVVWTPGGPGPFNGTYDTYVMTFLLLFLMPDLVVGFGFVLILMLYWWTRRAREIRGTRAPAEAKRAEGGGEFTCTNCGADVAEGDAKCPKCGAVFESEAEGESGPAIHPK